MSDDEHEVHCEYDVFEIASMWWSVMTWGDPGVCLYAFGSTGKVQSEEHRQQCLEYIKKHCEPLAQERNDDETEQNLADLERLAEYIREADIEPMEGD